MGSNRNRQNFTYVRCVVYEAIADGTYKKVATSYIQFKGARANRLIEIPILSTRPIVCTYIKDAKGVERLLSRNLKEFQNHPESMTSAEEFYRLWREYRGHEDQNGRCVSTTLPLRSAKSVNDISDRRNSARRRSEKKERKLSDSKSISSLRHAASKLSIGGLSMLNLHNSKSASNVLDQQEASSHIGVSPHSIDDEGVGSETLKLSPASSNSDLSSSSSGRDSGFSSASHLSVASTSTTSGSSSPERIMETNFLNPKLWECHQPINQQYEHDAIQALIHGKGSGRQSKQQDLTAKPALRHYSTTPVTQPHTAPVATVLHPTITANAPLRSIPSFEIEDTDMNTYENFNAFREMLNMTKHQERQSA